MGDGNSLAVLLAIDIESQVVDFVAGLPREQYLPVVIRGRLGVEDFCKRRNKGNLPHTPSVRRYSQDLIGGIRLCDGHIKNGDTRKPCSQRRPVRAPVSRPIDAYVSSGEQIIRVE